MKKILAVLVSITLLFSIALSPVWAGGDKNQKEIGASSPPRTGGDANGNQAA